MYLVKRTTLLRHLSASSCRTVNAALQKRCLTDNKSDKPPTSPGAAKPESTPATPFIVPVENPISRTFRLLRADATKMKNFILPPSASKAEVESDKAEELTERKMADRQAATTEFQSHCDILIIGGGGVGASIAYWLKKRAFGGLNVVVLEKDPTVSLD